MNVLDASKHCETFGDAAKDCRAVIGLLPPLAQAAWRSLRWGLQGGWAEKYRSHKTDSLIALPALASFVQFRTVQTRRLAR